MRQLLADLQNVRLLTLADVGADFEVDETGQTYTENAALKAAAYAEAAGMICIADDSGLEVDALDGAPGIHSKRYGPQPGATDANRRRLLVANLSPHPRPWTARFRALVAV
ncbi:MAG TPA: non-canonical purine NTP pyrophosphatase, partial [Anaerolineales bacterium]|nr:non-canonical purine NTP pyrophosphatase [Anaerolineales bacterium]